MAATADQGSDLKQLVAAAFDVATQSLKTVTQSTSELTLTATSDSITAFPVPLATSALGTNATTGEVITPQTAVGVGSLALYVQTTSAITGSQALTVEVSPAASGSVWVATSITVTPSATNGVVVVSGPTKIAALRARVTIAAAITTGTFTAYLVNGN